MDRQLLASKIDIEFSPAGLTAEEQSVVSAGFHSHSEEQGAPEYKKDRAKWLALDEGRNIAGILTAKILWDWMYIDELWVSPEARSQGLGQRLMQLAEEFARSQDLQGLWLWTQSWQAEGFYRRLGFSEFTRFDNFPKGHSRIGFRKVLTRGRQN